MKNNLLKQGVLVINSENAEEIVRALIAENEALKKEVYEEGRKRYFNYEKEITNLRCKNTEKDHIIRELEKDVKHYKNEKTKYKTLNNQLNKALHKKKLIIKQLQGVN